MGLKRKSMTDFFTPSQKRPSLPTPTSPYHHPTIPGLEIHPSFITPAEESQILTILNTPPQTWRTDLSRRTMHFGGTYCIQPATSAEKPITKIAPPLPPDLDFLITRLTAQHFIPERARTQCIVNEYTGALGIAAHTESFVFDEPVLGLSLLAPVALRFHELRSAYDGSVRSGKAAKAPRTGRVVDVRLPGCSLCVMRGNSRWAWQHEIVRSAKGRGLGWRRVSLTIRIEKEK